MGFVNGFDTIGVGEIFQVVKGLTFGSLLIISGSFLLDYLLNIRNGTSLFQGGEINYEKNFL